MSYQFIPFTTDEKRFNDSTNSLTDRLALWPTGVISTNNKDALVFFTKVHLRPQSVGPWQDYGIGLAHFTPGQPVTRNPGLLFTYPDPNFQTPFIHDNYLYVYGYLRNKLGTGIGRVPIELVENRTAYSFWNGSSWGKDVDAAAIISDYSLSD